MPITLCVASPRYSAEFALLTCDCKSLNSVVSGPLDVLLAKQNATSVYACAPLVNASAETSMIVAGDTPSASAISEMNAVSKLVRLPLIDANGSASSTSRQRRYVPHSAPPNPNGHAHVAQPGLGVPPLRHAMEHVLHCAPVQYVFGVQEHAQPEVTVPPLAHVRVHAAEF